MVIIVSAFGTSKCRLCYDNKACMAKILDGKVSSTSSKGEIVELEEKFYSKILLSLLA
jgi:hypothetical protein